MPTGYETQTPIPQFWNNGGNESMSVNTPGPSGQGRYQDLYDANPYRDLHYTQSGWQKFLSGLGFRTSYDDFMEQAEINAKEYDAGIASMQFQNDYNNPAAEAQRMRGAGLNPDIQGIQDVAESAGPTEDPNGMPSQPSQDQQAATVLSGFAKGIYSCVMGGLSFAKDLTALKQMQSVVEGQSISNAKSMMGAIDEMIFGKVNFAVMDPNNKQGWSDMMNSMKDDFPDFESYGFSPRQIKGAQKLYNERLFSLANDEHLRELALKRYQHISGANKTLSEGYYGNGDMEEEVISIMIGTLANTVRDYYNRKASNDLAEQNVREGQIINEGIEANIREQYLDTLNDANYGTIEAGADVAEQRARRSTSAVEDVIASNKETLYKALQDAADHGNSKAQAVLYLMVINDLASFEVSGGIDLNFLKGIKAIASQVLSYGPKGNSGSSTSGSDALKNFGLGADVQIKIGNK